ncbi:MAG: hypothetical protein K1X88_02785 [Nannocystaceae bacterium]|nr:hypothetical protein [Nannocystaceae bacterium]
MSAVELATRWEPTRTRVLAVGILQYADRICWPLEGRRDAVLMETLRARGVPADNLTFLTDAAGTIAGIEQALQDTLARSRPDELLLIYYAGHGARDEKHGGGAFSVRDGRLPVSQMFAAIERGFAGRQAILTADCCYSGSLALEAPLRAGRVAYAALGSSLSTVTSTGAWTFTNCWIDALQGRVPVDLDGDGVLRLDELARYAEARLCVCDGQVCSFAVANGFPSTFELGPTRRRVHRREGEFVQARNATGDWARCEIVDVRPGDDGASRLVLRWIDDEGEITAFEHEVTPWQPRELAPGVAVTVRHGGKTYDGVVLAGRSGMHLVRYQGWDESWDEWVSPDRLVDA